MNRWNSVAARERTFRRLARNPRFDRAALPPHPGRGQGLDFLVNEERCLQKNREKHRVRDPLFCLSPKGQQDSPPRRCCAVSEPWTVETSRIVIDWSLRPYLATDYRYKRG